MHLHLARVAPDIGKGIEDMRQVLDGEVLGAMLARVDGPVGGMKSRLPKKQAEGGSPVDKVGHGSIAGARHVCDGGTGDANKDGDEQGEQTDKPSQGGGAGLAGAVAEARQCYWRCPRALQEGLEKEATT